MGVWGKGLVIEVPCPASVHLRFIIFNFVRILGCRGQTRISRVATCRAFLKVSAHRWGRKVQECCGCVYTPTE
jgi:hypothetical protein